jgi:hypothetical protein
MSPAGHPQYVNAAQTIVGPFGVFRASSIAQPYARVPVQEVMGR